MDKILVFSLVSAFHIYFLSLFQDAIAVTGAIIGGINIPERWFPGRLDLICNSHHLMHLLVVYAVYEMHLGVNLDLKWMTARGIS